MKTIFLSATVAAALALAKPAAATSFDCAKANSIPEYLICNTPDLSRADDQLKVLFDAARDKATDKKAFAENTRAQWNRREKSCRDVACLRQWYVDQNAYYASALGVAVPSMPPVAAATPQSSALPDQEPHYRVGPPLGVKTPLRNTAPSAPTQSQLAADDALKRAYASPTPPDVPAVTLYADYHANEVAADMKYKGKTIAINGIILEIGVDFSDDPYVRLAIDDLGFRAVKLKFTRNMSPRLAQLHRGQYVQATCVGSGMILGDPVLKCPDKP